MLRSIPTDAYDKFKEIYPLDSSTSPPFVTTITFPDIVNCPLGSKITQVENHWSRFATLENSLASIFQKLPVLFLKSFKGAQSLVEQTGGG